MSSCSNFESQMCSLLKQILAVLQTSGSELLGDVANITESVVPGVGSDDLGKEEDATHASGDTGVMMLGVRNDANIALTDANFDYSPIAVDSAGRIKFDGTSFTIGNIGSITTSVVPGTAATNLGKAEDAAHTTGDTGVFALAVRNDAAATTFAGTDGDYSGIAVDSTGRVFVNPGVAATSLGKAEDGPHTSGDVGVFALAVRNENSATLAGTEMDYSPIATNRVGSVFCDINYLNVTNVANSIVKPEDSAHASSDVGVMALAVRNDARAALSTTNLDYTPIAVTSAGSLNNAEALAEDSAATSGDYGFMSLGVIQAIPTSSAADGDYAAFKLTSTGYQYSDTVVRSAGTHTQPTVTTGTSFTILAANTARRYLLVQNNSAANIMINLAAGVLTGIVPTSTNLGIVIAPGGSYESPPNWCPVVAITGYQTSGGNINTVSVVEG